MTRRLAGQRVLIVGGTAGIGRATPRRMLDEGARVMLAGRTAARGQAALAALDSADAGFVQGDAGDPAACAAIVATAQERLGGIDTLVSCGGGDSPCPGFCRTSRWTG